MAKITYKADSPYYGTPQTQWYLLPRVHREIAPHGTDQRIIISAKDHLKPYMLSYDLYGTPAYWWVFSSRNIDLIRDPIYDFTSGLEILVPTRDRLNQILS